MKLFRPYLKGDVYEIYPELEEVMKGEFSVEAFEQTALQTSGYTIENGSILFTTFVAPLWTGCGSVCALMSNRVERDKKSLSVTKGAIAITEQWGKEGYRRIHTMINPAFPKHVKWCKALGFDYESTMHKALPDGSDVHMYVKWLNGG